MKPIAITTRPKINSKPLVNVAVAPVNMFWMVTNESMSSKKPTMISIELWFPAII